MIAQLLTDHGGNLRKSAAVLATKATFGIGMPAVILAPKLDGIWDVIQHSVAIVVGILTATSIFLDILRKWRRGIDDAYRLDRQAELEAVIRSTKKEGK